MASRLHRIRLFDLRGVSEGNLRKSTSVVMIMICLMSLDASTPELMTAHVVVDNVLLSLSDYSNGHNSIQTGTGPLDIETCIPR